MRSSLAMAGAAISLNIGPLSFASNALAEPNAEIATATSAWGQGLADPEKVSSLYSDDAVLWGTAAPKIRSGRGAVREYFVGVAKAVPGIKVEFGDQLIRVYGNTAINSGYYTFSWVRDGETKSLPARYSFTYVKDGDRWLIVDHHSSALPSPPK
ncbi:SgcJ/EcaC family oxidoreductase [Bradyrhizobium vignae]|uniref:DUF4440 domain-containing protein n=1 Tax=Bradyrhizobium vignae TaxID=1549949 RepID=A0A2U3PVG7_9BRAD|nr:SgcJ/EcaC family oxidoreductase [Bradyrhizobium vignae]SPP93152.1 conserved exported protein of unknown function [Bradyrhizobium vignae]